MVSGLIRVRDWPLRAKLAFLLALSSVVPLAIAAYIDLRDARGELHRHGEALLAARADQLADKLDTFHRGYQLAVAKLSLIPDIVALATSLDDAALAARVRGLLLAHPASDPNILALGVLRPDAHPVVVTRPVTVEVQQPYLREALQRSAISELHVVNDIPAVAYAAPVLADGRALGIVVVWVKAEALWSVARSSNELAGSASFAVVFDHDGIRIAHTYSKQIVFHPGGRLDPATVDAMVARQRFGPRTRRVLEQPWDFPEQFERAKAAVPDPGLFEGYAPVNSRWNYGVTRRLATVPWTTFYMVPAASLDAPLAQLTRDKLVFAAGIIIAALAVGAALASVFIRRVHTLVRANLQLASGDLAARTPARSGDELGKLAASFNDMAARIESQDAQLRMHAEELERRVAERTAELVEAKAAVEQSEQSLAITLDSIGDAVIATDTECRVVRMNPVAQQLTGWSVGEARGRPLDEVFCIVNESTRVRIASPAPIVLERGLTVGLANHTSLLSRDGSERAIADSGAPIRDSEGTIRGVVIVFRDQTQEREADRQLRMSEARTAAVMNAALDAIVVLDRGGRIIDLNAAAEHLLGHRREDALGRLLAESIVPPVRRGPGPGGLLGLDETAISEVLGRRIEVRAMRRDGSEFPAEIAIVAIGGGGAHAFTGYIRDISERKRAAEVEVMRRAKEAAEAANVELEAFSYSVAHDLRAPLRAINGFSQALIEDFAAALEPEARGYLTRIAGGARRMGQLIDGLLALARISRYTIQRERVDLGGIAQAIVAHFDRSRDIVWSFADGVVADGDPRLLHSLLENLLGNAWKFTRDRVPAIIELGVAERDGAATYYVKDNGVGFDMARARRLFAPFHRLHEDAEFEGTGIGLATVDRIVRRHGGRIWAESAPGQGTTFYFTLWKHAAPGDTPHADQGLDDPDDKSCC